jgi:hypothetical protein
MGDPREQRPGSIGSQERAQRPRGDSSTPVLAAIPVRDPRLAEQREPAHVPGHATAHQNRPELDGRLAEQSRPSLPKTREIGRTSAAERGHPSSLGILRLPEQRR